MNAKNGLNGGRARRGPRVPPAVMRRGVRLIGIRGEQFGRRGLDQQRRQPGVDVTYTRWPGLWHDFVLQPGLLSAADSAVAQAAWFAARVTPPPR